MARSDARHGQRPGGSTDRRRAGGALGRWLPVALVLAVLAAGLVAWRLDLGRSPAPDPVNHPAEVLPPVPGLAPAPAPPTLADAAPAAGQVHTARLDRAVKRLVGDPDLGRDVHVRIAPLSGGAPVYEYGDGLATPASTLKLLTSTAALQALGPEHTFATTVTRRGDRVTLVGGGDPLLARAPSDDWPKVADLATLARETAKALEGTREVRLRYDATLFRGDGVNPHWEPGYVPDSIVSPITALWVDEGRRDDSYLRVDDPAATAATEFAADLAKRGVKVVGTPVARQSAPSATEIARVESPPLSQIVEHVLLHSDNEGAEVLAHQVGVAVSHEGSFAAGVKGVEQVLRALDVRLGRSRLLDGSGLSRGNRVDPRALVDVLRLAASHDRLRAILTGLPVAGFTGSLAYRFDDVPEAGVGRVRAKTGTLTGVSGLAGIATTRSGAELVFVLVADKVRLAHTLDAREALDRLAATLAAAA